MITEELCYLSIDEAFLCLTNEMLPDELRTVYCSLIRGECWVWTYLRHLSPSICPSLPLSLASSLPFLSLTYLSCLVFSLSFTLSCFLSCHFPLLLSLSLYLFHALSISLPIFPLIFPISLLHPISLPLLLSSFLPVFLWPCILSKSLHPYMSHCISGCVNVSFSLDHLTCSPSSVPSEYNDTLYITKPV